ncbi:MAG TPA: cytidylate kinase [Archaeoglobaceae archaeon]|nr:cytidylate kinase [Archaeoglobaceae archaeon]
MRITISGLAGAGTTTVAKMLASKLDYILISAGEIFREMAKKRNCSLEQFSKIAENDSEIDLYIDRMQKELAEKEDNAVVEGRLSGWMIEDAFKVFIFAEPDIRYSRIAKREHKDINQAREETVKREKYERRRYKKFYGIDIDDWSIYHLILNSGYFEAEEIVEIILKAVEYV